MPSTDESGQPAPREAARERYQRVVRVVAANTGTGASPTWRDAGCKPSTVISTLSRAGFDHRDVRKSIRATVERGDLVSWTARDGGVRLTPSQPDDLRRVAEAAATREEPNRELIAGVNQRLEADDPTTPVATDGGESA